MLEKHYSKNALEKQLNKLNNVMFENEFLLYFIIMYFLFLSTRNTQGDKYARKNYSKKNARNTVMFEEEEMARKSIFNNEILW